MVLSELRVWKDVFWVSVSVPRIEDSIAEGRDIQIVDLHLDPALNSLIGFLSMKSGGPGERMHF